MTSRSTCPCCGSEVEADVALSARQHASRFSSTYATLRGAAQPPQVIAHLRDASEDGGPTWWLPSLAYLAYHSTDNSHAHAVLDEFASRRDELNYAVVEEETDEMIGLTVQPWPVLDEHGRLRFPIDRDPDQVELPAADFANLVREGRERWHDLGLLPREMVDRPVRIGDTFALVLGTAADSGALRVHDTEDGTPRFLGRLSVRDVAVPVIDITWDAREAGKLAHYAAAAGVASDEHDPTTAAVAGETEARYLTALDTNRHPRDVRPEEVVRPEATR